MEFSNINFLAVLVATVASFAFGAIWYGPLFGKAWQKEMGFTDEYLKEGNMAMIFGPSLVLTAVMAIGMAMILKGHGGDDMNWMTGLTHGLYIGVAFIAASKGINYLYQRQSLKLWLIDSGYQTIFLAMMGAIIGAW